MRFICINGIPDSWLYNAIATGAPQLRGEALERLRFWRLNRNTFSVFEFWNNILTIFSLVIFFTSW